VSGAVRELNERDGCSRVGGYAIEFADKRIASHFYARGGSKKFAFESWRISTMDQEGKNPAEKEWNDMNSNNIAPQRTVYKP
jgi:hypothetical protein